MNKLWRDNRGAVLVMLAITIPVLLGMAGLGVDAGMWYVVKRHNQTAADMAAVSGALEVQGAEGYGFTGNIYPDLCAMAQQDAANNGFTFTGFTCPTTSPGCTNPASGQMCANYPPVLGPNAGNPNYVEVILAQQQATYFSSLFLPNVNILNRAVAYVKTFDQSCILALASTGPGVWAQGGASSIINTGSCAITADSSSANAFNFVGNPTITAGTLTTSGGITGGTNNVSLASPPMTGVAPTLDPYASVYTHTALQAGMPTTCTAGPSGSGTFVYNTNVRFCGGLSIGNKQTVDFQPPASGYMIIWITDGDLSIKNGTLECTTCVPGGAGITIILTKGTGANAVVGGVSMPGGNGTIDSLNAPATGPFTGLLIAQDAAGPFDNPGGNCKVVAPCSNFQGNTGATFDGIVYFPDTSLNFLGNPTIGSNSCLLLVAYRVEVDGSASFNDAGCPAINGVPKVTTVALSE